MESIDKSSYYNKYLTYKLKYLKLKNTQSGGTSETLYKNHLDELIKLRNMMETIINKIKELVPNFENINARQWASVNQSSVNQSSVNDSSVNQSSVNDSSVNDSSVNQSSVNDSSVNDSKNDDVDIEDLADELAEHIIDFRNYINENDIPLNYSNLNLWNENGVKDVINFLMNSKKELTPEYLQKMYDIREKIYSMKLDKLYIILDYIIKEFNIKTGNDLESLFNSNLLGYNKNYIIYYMVMLRLMVNNKQKKYDGLSFMVFNKLNQLLSNTKNDEEYLPLFSILINDYIKTFFKDGIIYLKPFSNFEDKYFKKTKLLEYERKIPQLKSYDLNTNSVKYYSGFEKFLRSINFNDLKQILFNIINQEV
jgi:hypothetical protein